MVPNPTNAGCRSNCDRAACCWSVRTGSSTGAWWFPKSRRRKLPGPPARGRCAIRGGNKSSSWVMGLSNARIADRRSVGGLEVPVQVGQGEPGWRRGRRRDRARKLQRLVAQTGGRPDRFRPSGRMPPDTAARMAAATGAGCAARFQSALRGCDGRSLMQSSRRSGSEIKLGLETHSGWRCHILEWLM